MSTYDTLFYFGIMAGLTLSVYHLYRLSDVSSITKAIKQASLDNQSDLIHIRNELQELNRQLGSQSNEYIKAMVAIEELNEQMDGAQTYIIDTINEASINISSTIQVGIDDAKDAILNTERVGYKIDTNDLL